MAVSGVFNALVRLPVHDLFVTGYGLLVVAKIAALFALGALGFQQRKRAVRAVQAGGRRALVFLSTIELLVMALTFGVSAALSRTAPPADGATVPSIVDVQIGYDLTVGPNLSRLLFAWRFDLVYGTLAIACAALYVLGVRRLRRNANPWPIARTTAWLIGCLVLLFATSSGIGKYAPAMFSVHIASQLLLMVVAPVFFVAGRPMALARQALPDVGGGPRDWLLAASGSPAVRLLTRPLVALVLFAGSSFAWYFTGLFGAALTVHWAHLAMNAGFLVIGCAYYVSIMRLPVVGRLGMLLAALPCFALFGITLIGRQDSIGGDFYQSLGLPWVDAMADQRLGAVIAWGLSEVPLVLLVLVLLVRWPKHTN
jgi:putative copper resistance protein D